MISDIKAIRCRSCHVRLADRHDGYLELRYKELRLTTVSSNPVFVDCPKCKTTNRLDE